MTKRGQVRRRGGPGQADYNQLSAERLEPRRLFNGGSLDPTFGVGGSASVHVPGVASPVDQANAALLQPDGKVVAAGSSSLSSDTALALARYNPDGTLDPTFGAGGLVVQPQLSAWDLRAVARQADGKIVAAGRIGGSNVAFVARYNANGTADGTFGAGGQAFVRVGTSSVATGVAVLADGRILVAGSAGFADATTSNFFVARLTAAGALDPTFGSGGTVVTDVGGNTYDDDADMAVAADGRIVVAGTLNGNPNGDWGVVRYLPDGALDPAFDGDGRRVIDFAGGDDWAASVAVWGGKIVVGGAAGDPAAGTYRRAFARLNDDGTLDPTFGAGGRVVEGAPVPMSVGVAPVAAHGLAVDAAGRLVATGREGGTAGGVGVWRHLADGTLDPAFGTAGTAAAAFPGRADATGYAVLVQPDGRVVAAGTAGYPSAKYQQQLGTAFALARFDDAGRPDPAFGATGTAGGGRVLTDFPARSSAPVTTPTAAAVQPDGKILAAGNASIPGSANDVAVARFTADGAPDPAFGDGGRVLIGGIWDDQISAVLALPGGKVLLGGRDNTPDPFGTGYHRAFYRLNADGSADTTFGDNGLLVTPLAGNVNVLALQTDGKVLAGNSDAGTAGGLNRALLTRYSADGTLDPTFGAGGTVGWNDAATGGLSVVALAVQPDGRIVAVTASRISRFLPDGSPDPSFGSAGFVSLAARPLTQPRVGLVPDGKILLASVKLPPTGSGWDWAVDRLNPDGSPDESFGFFGRVVTDLGDQDVPTGVAALPDGRVLVTGNAQNFGDRPAAIGNYPALARYNADGTLDQTFGVAGRAVVRPSNAGPGRSSLDKVAATPVVAGGKAVLVGSATDASGFGVARYVLDSALMAQTDGPYGPRPEGPLAVSGAASAYPGGQIVKYEWDAKYDGFVFDADAVGPTATLQVDDSAKMIGLRVTGADGLTHVVGTPVTATNVAPVVDAGPDAAADAGGRFRGGGSFADPGPDTWFAEVDYGDGTGKKGLPLAADRTFALDHYYAAAGTYAVSVRVVDDDGGQGTDMLTVAVPVGASVPPSVSAAAFDPAPAGGGPPVLRFTFTEDVPPGPPAGGLTVRDRATGAVVPAVTTAAYDPAARVATFTFDGGGAGGGGLAAGDYRATLTAAAVVDGTGHPMVADYSLDFTVGGPAVRSVLVNDGAAQRSMVRQVTVAFDQPGVTLDPGAFVLARRDGGPAPAVTVTPGSAAGPATFVLTFAGAGVVGGSLADGVYDLTIAAAKVHAATGQGLSADFAFKFHRLYSDADGDGDSDNFDLLQLRPTLLKPSTDPAYKWYFDYDDSGTVDNLDVFQVRSRRPVVFQGY